MAQVVITEFMDPESVAVLADEFDVFDDPSLAGDRQRLLTLLETSRALIVRNQTKVDTEVLDAAPELRLVARLGVGLDNIDVASCTERGIEVARATGANAVAVAEYVIAALLVLTRGVFGDSDRVVAGEWPRSELRGSELAGRTLGLIGFGVTAREVAKRARALGMPVLASDPFLSPTDAAWANAERVELDDLLQRSDAVSIHVPLTDETRMLIDSQAIALMPRGSVLVNPSRGGVVDESALTEALRGGHLGGAALDVYAREPLDHSSGAMFADVPNLILTPHVAGITRESEARIGAMAVEAVRRHLSS